MKKKIALAYFRKEKNIQTKVQLLLMPVELCPLREMTCHLVNLVTHL